MCDPNFILEKPFRLFDFTLDSSSVNQTRTRTWTRGIRSRTRTRDLWFWWTRTWTRSLGHALGFVKVASVPTLVVDSMRLYSFTASTVCIYNGI